MAVSALNPQEFVTSEPAVATRPSKLPAFLQFIAQYDREFAIYDDGWRGWSYQYSDIARMAAAFAVRLHDSGIGKGLGHSFREWQ